MAENHRTPFILHTNHHVGHRKTTPPPSSPYLPPSLPAAHHPSTTIYDPKSVHKTPSRYLKTTVKHIRTAAKTPPDLRPKPPFSDELRQAGQLEPKTPVASLSVFLPPLAREPPKPPQPRNQHHTKRHPLFTFFFRPDPPFMEKSELQNNNTKSSFRFFHGTTTMLTTSFDEPTTHFQMWSEKREHRMYDFVG